MNASFRLSALALALASVSSQATEPASDQLPSGSQVQAGQANISQAGHQLTVTQSSDRAVIDWQSFDVGSDAQVHFDQPSVSSATLNRVLSSNPTQVMGRITAPGQVFLVNPNGVLFGPNSQVDVGGLAASTLDIDDADFMAGDLRFHSGAGSGSITSQGEIETTLGGFVALLAPEVINEGLIVAPYGRVAMAAGERIEIDLDGQGRWVQVEPALVDTLIENRHAIEVNAGQILLSSRAANELARGVIRQSGTLTANSMVQSGGRILLEGDDIHLSSSAQIQANGALGGGDVLIGGDWQGGQNAERRVFDDPNTLHQADTVRMEAGASIRANATDNGDGGTVVLWSDIRKSGGSTRAYGDIQAQGGPNGGDGGQVETSGAYLDVAGISVSTLATAGANGVWLLDPANITLGGSGDSGSIPGSEGPASDTNLDYSTIDTALQSGNVEIYTGDAGSGTASITMAGGTKWNFRDSNGNSLTLRAHNTVNISGELTNSGGIHLIGDNIVIGTSGQNADVIVNHAGSDLTLTAADYIMTNDSIRLQTQGGDIVLWSDSDNSGQGHIQLGTTNTFSSGGGDIILAGGEDTNSDSRPDGYAVTSGANSKPGVRLGADGSRVELTSSGGDITIRGEHNSTSATGQGVTLTRNMTMNAGTGAIEMEGRSNNGIGIDFGTSAPSTTYSIVSAKTSGTAIRIVGAQTATSSTSNVAIRSAMSGSFSPNIAATGGGDVIIQGTNSTSATTDALALGNMQIQASAGNISIDGGTQGISFGAGSRAGAGTLVSSSTADVTIRADRLSLKSLSVTAGDLSLVSSSDSFTSLTLPTAAMQVSDYTIGSTTNTLALTLQNSIGSGSSVIGGDISIYAGDLTIKDGLTIAARPGFDVLVSSSGNFTNLAGSTAINTSNGGRWLVFAADAADNTYGSLDSGNQAIWGEDVSTFDASSVSGNRYVFGALTGQTVAALTVTSADASKVYGTVADLSNSYTISGGYVQGESGAYQGTQPTNYELSDLYSVNPTFSSTLSAANADVGSAAITISGGTVLSGLSVTTVNDGTLTVTPRPLVLTASADNKVYDGTNVATGSITSDALDGDDISIGAGTPTFSQSNIGTGLTVTFNGPTKSGTDAGNYTLPGDLTTATADITARPLTLSGLVVQDKTYDQSTGAAVDNFGTLTNIVSGETVTLDTSGVSAVFDSADAGSRTATISGLSLSGAGAANYSLADPTGSATINPLMLTLGLTGQNKVYDQTTDATVTVTDNALTGDDVTVTYDADFDDRHVGDGKTVTLTNIGLTGSQAGNYAVPASQTTTANITPRSLTITISASDKVYDGSDAASITFGDNRISGDRLSFAGSASFDNANAATGKTVTAPSIAVSGTDAGNYSYNTSATDTANITSKALTATATVAGKTYDGNDDASITLSLAGLVSGEDLGQTVTASFDSVNAGSRTATIDSFQLDDGTNGLGSNYSLAAGDITFTANTATIATRAITLTAADVSQVYGDSDTTLSVTASANGLASTDTLAEVTGMLTRESGSDVGNYDVALGTGSKASNYSITFDTDNNAYEITPKALTATASVTGKSYDGNDDASVTLSLVGLVSGEDLGQTVTASFDSVNAGTRTATIDSFQLDDGTNGLGSNYTLAAGDITFTANTATIATRAITLTAADVSQVYGDSDATLSVTASANGLASTDTLAEVTGTLTRESGSNVGSYDVALGTGSKASNYAITFDTDNNAYEITPKALTATATVAGKTYDGNDDASVTLSLAGLVSGEDLGQTVTASFDSVNAGTRTVTIDSFQLDDGTNGLGSNYSLAAGDITFTANTATIATRAITLTAADVSQVYGDSDATLSVTASANGLASTDTLAEVTGTLTRESGSDVGNYDVVLGTGSKASNYAITFDTDNNAYEITPLALTLSGFTVADKTYDSTTAATVSSYGTFTNLVGADVVSIDSSSVSAVFDNANVGTRTATVTGIALSGADAGNYSIADQTDNASITAFTLDLGLTASDKVYDGSDAATVNASPNAFSDDDVSVTFNAAFSNENVADNKVISLSSLSLTGTDAGNYALPSTPSVTANITPKPLTLTYTANNRVYDGTTDATVSFTDDRISGDTLTVSETAAFADKNVGNGKTVSITGVTLGGTDAANYSLVTPTNPTANITARDLTLTYTGNNRVYDGTTDATVSVTDDRITDDVLSITQTAAFADKDVGSGKTISLSGVSVTGTDAGNYNVLTPTNPTADITARSLTVTIDAANKVYDGNTNASVTYADNRVDSDVLSVTGTASFANKNVGTGKTVTASSISLSGTDAGNYTINTSATDTADITTRTLTVNLTGDNRVYDGTTDATISSTDDRVSGDNLALDYTAAFSDPNVGNGKSISVTGISLLGSDAGNYSVASTGSTTANITARSLTVTADASDKVYDGNTTASVTYSDNRISGDDVSVSGTATFDNENVGSGKTVSISGISLSGDDAGNYTVNSTASDTAAITARALTLNGFSIADKTYDQSTSATVASYGTLANLVSGDTVSIDSSSVSSTFDSANVGTRTATVTGIALSGADAANYSIADQTGSAEITAFTLDLGLTATDKVYDGTDSASVTASPNELSGDDVSVTFNAAFSNKNVANNKVINLTNLTLSGTDAANYALPVSPSVTADITARDLTLTYTAADRVYDGSTNANVSVTDNRISGDTLSITQSAAFADKNVGNNKTVTLSGVSLSGTDAANYNLLTPTNPTADITARDLTLTYTGTNRVYDGTTDATVTVSDDRVSGDVLSIAQTAAFADKNVGSGKTISLSGVNLTGTDAANYNLITPTNPTADITARSLTVTADASDKVYDGNNTASATYSDNRVSGDVLTVSGSAAFDNKHVGSGKSVTVSGISLAGADAANYSVNTSASDTANISARTLTLNLTGDNRVYDGTTDATVSVADDRVAGDNIALDYSAAFSDKNVGNGKTISVTGISLLGSDASNYSVASSDSTTGDITARALNFTVAAQNKVYDQSSTAQVNITDDRVSGDDLSASFTASFSDDQAGANKAVAINGFALNGTDAANYSYTAPTSTTASITQRVLDLTVAAQDKVYDGTQSATVTVTDDRLSGDTLSYTYNSQFVDKNVGTGKAVQLAGLALTGADASNYQLPSNVAGSASITARTLNITANPINRVYDGTRAVNVSYSDDRISGDDFSISATALMTDKLAGANKSVTLSNLALSGIDAGNYAATIASLGLVDIDRRTLTVSADAKDKNYDATRIALVDLTDDRISGDQLSLAYSALFENAQAGTNKLVDLLSLNLSGSDAPNYRLGSLPLGLRADIVNQQANNLVFAPVKASDSDLTAGLDVDKEILQIDQGLTAVALPEPPKVDTGPITVEVIAEPDVEFNGMVVVTMDLEKVESARFALPSSIRQLKPVGVQASAELRGGAPLPEWLTFDPDTMEFEALGNAQLDAPMQVDLVFGQYRLSVLVLPEELEAL